MRNEHFCFDSATSYRSRQAAWLRCLIAPGLVLGVSVFVFVLQENRMAKDSRHFANGQNRSVPVASNPPLVSSMLGTGAVVSPGIEGTAAGKNHAFARLQKLLGRRDAPPTGVRRAASPMRLNAVAYSPPSDGEERQRKIQRHLSREWRDSRRGPPVEYHFRPTASASGDVSFSVENPNHRLAMDWNAEGLIVRPKTETSLDASGDSLAKVFAGDWSFGLQWTGLGYEGAVEVVPPGQSMFGGHWLQSERPGVSEWFINTPAGLEHGFTLSEPPGRRPSPEALLRLELGVHSALQMQVTPCGESLQMEDARGTPILRYENLLAFDAMGRELPAHMEFGVGETLALVVDDRTASYPVTVDPVVVGLVKDINSDTDWASPDDLVDVNGILFFTARESTGGIALWKSDGSAAGTVRVKSFFSAPGPGVVNSLTAAGGTLYLVVGLEAFSSWGWELWKSNGTEAGTFKVKEITPTLPSFREPFWLTAKGDTLFFVAAGLTNPAIWKSDGTTDGTVVVKEIWPGWSSGTPASLKVVGDVLFFVADGGDANGQPIGRELWKTDGTETGTVLVKDIQPYASGNPIQLAAMDGILYFAAASVNEDNQAISFGLWKSDGTEVGTILIKDYRSGLYLDGRSQITAVGNTLYFVADGYDANNRRLGRELWKSDGTAAGTVPVKDIWPGAGWSNPDLLTGAGNRLFFTAESVDANLQPTGRELWRSDGTEVGTLLVKDVWSVPNVSSPFWLTAVGDRLYFVGYSYDENGQPLGNELWTTDGTAAGTVMVEDLWPGSSSSNPANLTSFGNKLIFSADDGQSGAEVWYAMEIPDTQPKIEVAFGGGHIQLSWPATAVGYQVAQSASLASNAVWQPVDGSPVQNDGRWVLGIEPGGGPRFFRLKQQ